MKRTITLKKPKPPEKKPLSLLQKLILLYPALCYLQSLKKAKVILHMRCICKVTYALCSFLSKETKTGKWEIVSEKVGEKGLWEKGLLCFFLDSLNVSRTWEYHTSTLMRCNGIHWVYLGAACQASCTWLIWNRSTFSSGLCLGEPFL